MRSPASPSQEQLHDGPRDVSRRHLLALTPALLVAGCAAPSASQATAALTVTNAVDRQRDIAVIVRTASGSDVLAETLSLGAEASRTLEFTTYARSVAINVETADISNTVTVDLSSTSRQSLAVTVSETQTGWEFDA